jgi:hypothetical protein
VDMCAYMIGLWHAPPELVDNRHPLVFTPSYGNAGLQAGGQRS